MKLLAALAFLAACSPLANQVADDVVKGEVKVIEQVVNDISGNPPKPSVKVVNKKF